jgi:hypothetical protein
MMLASLLGAASAAGSGVKPGICATTAVGESTSNSSSRNRLRIEISGEFDKVWVGSVARLRACRMWIR